MTMKKTINLLIFILAFQAGFSQIINPKKFYQLHENFKTVEDSISKQINPINTLIYKTCDDYRAFYFIKDSIQWTGYFIKNLEIDGLIPPTEVDLSGKERKPFLTELYVFKADSLYLQLVKNGIYKVRQISEDSIQTKLIKKTKKKNVMTVLSLPQRSHDCYETIIIYGKENKIVSYRGALIEFEELHIIPTLKIFYESEQTLINATKHYYR
jgi:hypothetical protein